MSQMASVSRGRLAGKSCMSGMIAVGVLSHACRPHAVAAVSRRVVGAAVLVAGRCQAQHAGVLPCMPGRPKVPILSPSLAPSRALVNVAWPPKLGKLAANLVDLSSEGDCE
ncbi:hypothetical protein HAX54_018987 [Datura stramonium]|uniref:Uncharacterized protein n=1 Tax=Datura stramonium TaxID=4076 RepID=A0ABS8UN82_DATST|nr:hypothetical protein [Datura stramonium]